MFITQILWCFLLATVNNAPENLLIMQPIIITEIILEKNEEIPEFLFQDMTDNSLDDLNIVFTPFLLDNPPKKAAD